MVQDKKSVSDKKSESIGKTKKSKDKVNSKTKTPKAKSSKKSKNLKMLLNSTIIAPVATEKAIMMVDTQNTLVFYVHRNARKRRIKHDVETLLNVKVDEVRTAITMNGRKKAYVKINEEYLASDLAGRLGMM